MFVILIGSVARGDYSINSDIDICKIDSEVELLRRKEWPLGPINYIDYNYEEFMHLYFKGSLFIYHVLYEGILIEGNKNDWEELRKNFVFIDDFNDEIDDIKSIIFDFIDINIFGESFLTLYSNLFTLIKNYSIFSLAQEGIFMFNKEEAVKMKFGDQYYNLLFDSYNTFERGLINEGEKCDCASKKLAIQVINYYKRKMGVTTC